MVTTAATLPELGPALEQIPAEPLEIITMLPGPVLNERHAQFLREFETYRPGSGRVEAVYPGAHGDIFILTWQVADPFGRGFCKAATPPDALPTESSCSEPAEGVHALEGFSQSSGQGVEEHMIEHTRDADAVVIGLADGNTYVVIPGDTSFSFHRWEGPNPIRFTIFWNDGTSQSHVVLP